MNLIFASDGKTVINADYVKKFYIFRPLESKKLENGGFCSSVGQLYNVYADDYILSSHKSYDGAKRSLNNLCNNIGNIGGIYKMEDTE